MLIVALLAWVLVGEPTVPSDRRWPEQLLVVVTDDWDVSRGKAWWFEDGREAAGPFVAHVGHSGLGWGIGRRRAELPGPVKREGDGRAPAGLFDVGYAWRWPWTYRSWCVDDARSASYGRIVSADGPNGRWRSAEDMTWYRVAIEVGHNAQHTRGRGSCIFIHDGDEPTVGCTAFSPEVVDHLLSRLRPGARMVQLPRTEYQALRDEWSLPALPGG